MIKRIDHLVITSTNPNECIKFYLLCGFKLNQTDGRMELYANQCKINVHTFQQELEPHAKHIQPGSSDFCLEVSTPLVQLQQELKAHGYISSTVIVTRTGTYGPMQSIYYYDYDGNLVELCNYPLNK